MTTTAAKGYWIAHVTVHDPEGYKLYIAANAAPLAKFGARFLVRSGRHEVTAGAAMAAGQRHVVIEFDSLEAAKACYASADYQAAAKIRDRYSTASVLIIEGYTG
jgi:uncharacterized protein (DUF1330 family)